MLLLIGADNTAMAEFDNCGGSEAAKLAAADGDILDCCCCCCCQGAPMGGWEASAAPGIGIGLPEACMDGEVCQAGAGWLGGILAKGVCLPGGIGLAANGKATGGPASGAPGCDCWE